MRLRVPYAHRWWHVLASSMYYTADEAPGRLVAAYDAARLAYEPKASGVGKFRLWTLLP